MRWSKLNTVPPVRIGDWTPVELFANGASMLESEGGNANLFLDFQPVKVKKRVLNKPFRGVLTFGADPPPIDVYNGPTGRGKVKSRRHRLPSGRVSGVYPHPQEVVMVPGGRENR